jgi:hypothetical protein
MLPSAARQYLADLVVEWRGFQLANLEFWRADVGLLVVFALTSLSILVLAARSLLGRRQPGRHCLVIPAFLDTFGPSRLRFLRHLPLLLFAAGVPCLAVAVADPYVALVRSEVSYPGRRIAIMIDASLSMRMPFKTQRLNPRADNKATFFTTVAAAERFVRLRMGRQYRDLMALIEFGDRAYVVMPFTNDYDNLLLSISLIGEPAEYELFPEAGTTIAAAIDQSVGLFKAFNFLDAAGNIMVLFSDGEDTNIKIGNRTIDEVLQNSIDNKIPVYMVRTNYDRGLGKVTSDGLWMSAIAKTGGRFYAVANEDSLLAAIADIDNVAEGTIASRQYTTQTPRFGIFALGAVAFFLTAAALKLAVPQFQKTP